MLLKWRLNPNRSRLYTGLKGWRACRADHCSGGKGNVIDKLVRNKWMKNRILLRNQYTGGSPELHLDVVQVTLHFGGDA